MAEVFLGRFLELIFESKIQKIKDVALLEIILMHCNFSCLGARRIFTIFDE
jgi:hypothetical protein